MSLITIKLQSFWGSDPNMGAYYILSLGGTSRPALTVGSSLKLTLIYDEVNQRGQVAAPPTMTLNAENFIVLCQGSDIESMYKYVQSRLCATCCTLMTIITTQVQ